MTMPEMKNEDMYPPSDPNNSGEYAFVNPFQEPELNKTPPPCILVIFGASGDLTSKKLIPAVFNLMKDTLLPTNFACVGFARREKDNESFRAEMTTQIKAHSRNKPEDVELQVLNDKLYYFRGEFDSDEAFINLKAYLENIDKQQGTKGNRIFYLSVQPSYFIKIIEKLKQHGLVYDPSDKGKFSRVIIEKPFGRDYDSAIALQNNLTKFLVEEQIYRIDHYLGKETVQNLLVFRFSNALFENIWNSRYIDNIQITVAESIGIEARGAFYEGEGLLRDILQNHATQLLSLVTMEPPSSLDPNAIRDEKVKVLQSIQPLTSDELSKYALRGQYADGYIEGESVIAYRKEAGVNPNSNVETFAAIRLQIENWRWSGVPIYVRGGKRLAKRATEIVFTLKRAPNVLFQAKGKNSTPNQIVFRIQPQEGTSIKFLSKIPGTPMIQPVNMDFQYAQFYGQEIPEAYERLIHDCICGDSTLFARQDEAFNSWKFYTPILNRWSESPLTKDDFYEAGTWGPLNASDLLKKENRKWRPV